MADFHKPGHDALHHAEVLEHTLMIDTASCSVLTVPMWDLKPL